MPGASGAAPPAGADKATALHEDPPADLHLVQEIMALGINQPVQAGTDEAAPALARTLIPGLDQHLLREAIRLY